MNQGSGKPKRSSASIKREPVAIQPHSIGGGIALPKTRRGQETRKKLLDAAAVEFGARGFHDASISEITRRAGVALGTFYVYFTSKDEVFRGLVEHMGRLTRAFLTERIASAPDRLTAERDGLIAFVGFAREHKDLYRIVMESQFVAEDAYRAYYSVFAEAYRHNLERASARGEVAKGDDEVRAWALIGVSVFLGLRYGVWDETRTPEEVGEAVWSLIRFGLTPRTSDLSDGEAS
jgi:AcrR family transcriptional regulator